MFFKKNLEKVDMIPSILQKISSLELEMEKMKTHIISLRGLVNRKLGGGSEIKEINPNDPMGVLLPETKD